MSEHSVIVWDLETVPDLAAAARMLDLGDAAETDVREALGDGFPKHPLHKIACIVRLNSTSSKFAMRSRATAISGSGGCKPSV